MYAQQQRLNTEHVLMSTSQSCLQGCSLRLCSTCVLQAGLTCGVSLVSASKAGLQHALQHAGCGVPAGMGIVQEVGEGVTGWQEGDRVTAAPWSFAHLGYGTWQEYVNVKAEDLVRPGPPITDLALTRSCKPRAADAAPAVHCILVRAAMHGSCATIMCVRLRYDGLSTRCEAAGRRAARGV